MSVKYLVTLTAEEREELDKLVRTGTAPGRARTHAQILLKADRGPDGPDWTDAAIQVAFDVGAQTIHRVRQDFVEHGLERALHRRRPTGWRARKLDGAGEAYLLALTCSVPPTGRKHWGLRLLADELVTLGHVAAISHETVRSVLKKRNQTVAEGGILYSAGGRWRVCVPYGRSLGLIPGAPGSPAPVGLL